MEELLKADAYRRVARFYEKELLLLEDDPRELNQLFLPVVNHLHYFPRATQQANVLRDELAVLKQRVTKAIAVLNTLVTIAQVKERGKEMFPVYPLLEEQLKEEVKYFVDFFNARKGRPSIEEPTRSNE